MMSHSGQFLYNTIFPAEGMEGVVAAGFPECWQITTGLCDREGCQGRASKCGRTR